MSSLLSHLHPVSLSVGALVGIAGSAVYSRAHAAKLAALGTDIKAEITKLAAAVKAKV